MTKTTLAKLVKKHIAEWEITLENMQSALKRLNFDLERVSRRLQAVNDALEEIPVSEGKAK